MVLVHATVIVSPVGPVEASLLAPASLPFVPASFELG